MQYVHIAGVNVMITIFCDFGQFSAKKLAIFLKTNVTIQILQKCSIWNKKRKNVFANFFGENRFKSITLVHVQRGTPM
jgi:hypothetical protein